MDPLTAFSLACGVIQVVDFSTKTLVKCKEIYREGFSSEYRELESMTRHLVDVRAGLDLPGPHQSADSIHKLDDQSILELAKECSITADQLIGKLRSVKTKGPHEKRQAIMKTLKLLWEKGEIQEIQKRLDGYRNTLDTQILINLRFVESDGPKSSVCHLKLTCADPYVNRQRVDLASLQHNKEFRNLDEKIQKLIQSFSQRPVDFEELRALIQTDNEKTREHVHNKLQEHERRLAEEEYRTRLLDSLWFAEILSREETIAEVHSETFQWIFDRSGQAVRPWDNFIAWLKSGEGIYWISGKAGSGKSTLMSFLCQDERTIDALTTWAGTKDIFTPKFFFWSGGEKMQKSVEGLLRSLLWQILYEFPEMNVLSFDIGLRTELNRSISREHGSIGAWTRRRLQRMLLEVIDKLQNSCCLCFFIDGLDEFDEDEDELIAVVQDIVSSTGVKVCSSSRPYKVFEDAFGPSAKLRLQDLTYKDIQRYVTDRFQGVRQLKSMTSENEYGMNELKKELVTRAEGVFLWVSLAVKDQIRGLRNEDSPEQLRERLARLPSEVEGIYLRMLLQIDKPYRQEASRFLQMALNSPGWTLLEHALASYKDLDNILLTPANISKSELVLLCQWTRKRITTTCTGLLEVREHRTPGTESEASDTDTQLLDADSEDEASASDSKSETTDESDHGQVSRQPSPEPDNNDSHSDYGSSDISAEAFNLESYDTVKLIHRTAVDFMKVGQGKAFLEANLLPEFDPQLLYLKTLLGTLCLFPEYQRRGPSKVAEFMLDLVFTENRTGMAQIELCELIDRTMSVLDQGHPDWRPNSHWCTRWDRFLEMQAREQDRSYLSTRMSSRSSSRDSFYSARSDPMARRESIDAPAGLSHLLPYDFLGYAASWGLYHYVQQTLDCRAKRLDLETANYLLYCSTLSCKDRPRICSQSGLVADLLRRGGNPNTRLLTNTIWGNFLNGFYEYTLQCALPYMTRKTDPLSDWLSNFTEMIAAFVEHGADIHTIFDLSLDCREYPWLEVFGISLNEKVSSFKFDTQMSALSIIESYLSHQPQFSRIQEMFIARGALLYSRCATFHFRLRSKDVEYTEQWRKYELSEQESREFLELLAPNAVFCFAKGSGAEGSETKEALSHQRARFHDWIKLVCCYEEARLDPVTSPMSGSSSLSQR